MAAEPIIAHVLGGVPILAAHCVQPVVPGHSSPPRNSQAAEESVTVAMIAIGQRSGMS